MTKAHSPVQLGTTTPVQRLDWTALLAQHEHWLRTVVYARLGSAEGVDEVFQEVALAAVRQRAPLTDASKAAPWLYRLAVLQSLLYRRKHGRQRKLIDRFLHRAPPTPHDPDSIEPLAWLISEERRRLVRDALKRLQPRDAEILLLKYTQDWNYQQIAIRLGISHSAVEARLHRARARLRSEFVALELTEVNG